MLAHDIDYLAYMDLEANYRALQLAILKDMAPDRALAKVAKIYLHDPENMVSNRSFKYSDSDVEEMAKLRAQGYSYKAIADHFQCQINTVYVTLKRRGKLIKGIIGKDRRLADERTGTCISVSEE